MLDGREYLFSDSKYLKLDIEVPHVEMLAEAHNLREHFISYRPDATNASWYSLPLIGLGNQQPYSWNNYTKTAKEAADKTIWTDWCDKSPVTVDWLKNVYPSKLYGRTRFMLLKAGGKINFHKDMDYSVLAAVNVALNNPKNCKWHWRDGESLEFLPGDAYAMNLSYEHSIVNDSNEDRYHLIIHNYDFTEDCKAMFKRSMKQQNVQGNFCFSSELL
jgi:hypothetical protein